jgi:hypothetical protein
VPEAADRNGNFHGDDGRFVNLRDYVERIFDEREKATEFARATLERALNEARVTTDRALAEAKLAADERGLVLQRRIESLESGGAPFASRLDESMTTLKHDVSTLKENMVRTTALEELRKANGVAIEQQRRQLRLVFIAAAISFAFSLILTGTQLLH